MLSVTMGPGTMSLIRLVLPVLPCLQLNCAVGKMHELPFLSRARAKQPPWQTGITSASACALILQGLARAVLGLAACSVTTGTGSYCEIVCKFPSQSLSCFEIQGDSGKWTFEAVLCPTTQYCQVAVAASQLDGWRVLQRWSIWSRNVEA